MKTKIITKQISTSIATIAVLLGSFAVPASAAPQVELEGSSWYPSFEADLSAQSYLNSYRMSLLGEEAGSYSHLVSFALNGGNTALCQDGSGVGVVGEANGPGVTTNCDVTALDSEEFELSAQLVLPPCAEAGVDENLCIESVLIYEAGTTPTSATFDSHVPGPIVAVHYEIGLRKGSTMSLWDSSWTHEGGTGRYLVNAVVSAKAFRYPGETSLSYEGLRITVTPVEEADDIYFGDVTLSTSGPALIEENKLADKCGYTSGRPSVDGKCGRNHDFAPNTEVSVTVRVPDSVGGFFKGRMESPNVTVAPRDGHANTQLITATGISTTAPRVLGSLPYCIMPGDADVDPTKDCETASPAGNGGTINPDLATLPASMAQRALYEAGFSSNTLYQDTASDTLDFIDWAKVANNDTATAVQTLWSFSTMSNYSMDPCLNDTTVMHGIVTTNAMAYTDSPPEMVDGNLSYTVAGMHYMPDGATEVSGSYHLLLNRETVDCLYGSLGDSPTATVSIVDESNVEKTSDVSFSVDSDWLKLSATGFTFSQNTISVGLQAAVPPTPNSPSAPRIVAVTTPPASTTPPIIAAEATGAVLIGGKPTNVSIAPSTAKTSLEIKGEDWSLALSPSTTGSALNDEGELVLNPQTTPDVSGTGFQANSKASAYLIPSGATVVAALGITQASLRALATATLNLGEIAVDSTGAFTANLDLSDAATGDYILQINGAAPNGDIRSISVKATVADTSFKGWTKKISAEQVKVYAKNVVGAGKVQIFVNGEEIAWVNAADETDRKLRFAQGFNYLVRTIDLVPGKNRIEIKLGGVRQSFTTYSK